MLCVHGPAESASVAPLTPISIKGNEQYTATRATQYVGGLRSASVHSRRSAVSGHREAVTWAKS
jgi:hypothetical protein